MAEGKISELSIVDHEVVTSMTSKDDLLRGINLKSLGSSFILLTLLVKCKDEILKKSV